MSPESTTSVSYLKGKVSGTFQTRQYRWPGYGRRTWGRHSEIEAIHKFLQLKEECRLYSAFNPTRSQILKCSIGYISKIKRCTQILMTEFAEFQSELSKTHDKWNMYDCATIFDDFP